MARKSDRRNRRDGDPVVVEPRAQRLQHHRPGEARGPGRQHRAAPSPCRRHRRAEKSGEQQPGRHRGLLDRKHQRRQARRRHPAEQLRAGRRRDRGAAAADHRRGAKAQQPALGRRRHAAAEQDQRDLAHAQRAVADDKAAAPHLRDQRGGGREAEIDSDPGRIGAELGENQRRHDRRQCLADRGEGLLPEHRRQRDQHRRQRFPARGLISRFLQTHAHP